VESQRHRAHVISTGSDVLFTVNGCVHAACALRCPPAAAACVAPRGVRSRTLRAGFTSRRTC
jgi:hypothetical protein